MTKKDIVTPLESASMILGLHTLLYSTAPDETRAFFKDVLEFSSVDAGRGWLIFAMPPAELAVHPADGEKGPELYLMCDNISTTLAELAAKGVVPTRPVSEQRWGLLTAIAVPGIGEMGLYEPRHPLAIQAQINSGMKNDR